jgi:LmbE family N-acetylglucosaminyl deacetylase
MTSFQDFVGAFAQALERGQHLALGQASPCPRPDLPSQAPKVLLFSPHPDDEVIIGGLPLRLRREANLNVLNVAVTQGSNKARQSERLQELQRCCEHIGFGLIQTAPNGLEGINTRTRDQQPDQWAQAVDCIGNILREQAPHVVFFPHDDDWNSTHIGTHHLLVDALDRQPASFECLVVETEFWGAMKSPNLMVESSAADVADLIEALTFHVGEVNRNPYHLGFPAWLIDNVRRGGELVGGQGGAPPDFTFATLYRLRRWRSGQLEPVLNQGRFLAVSDKVDQILKVG